MTAVLFLKAPTAAGATQAQLEAGNYRKKHRTFQGLNISIENPKGSVRSGTDRDGKSWTTKMVYDYGDIRGSMGTDKDNVDCYVGPDEDASNAYIVHQRKAGKWDQYDEDKVMLGFDSEESAKTAYLQHYDDPRFLGPISAMPMDEFKKKVAETAKEPGMIKARILFMKSADSAPSVGDRIEFLSDRHNGKGPSSGNVTDRKVTVDGLYIRVKRSDTEELLSWDDLAPHARRGKHGWVIKSHVRGHTRRTKSGKTAQDGEHHPGVLNDRVGKRVPSGVLSEYPDLAAHIGG